MSALVVVAFVLLALGLWLAPHCPEPSGRFVYPWTAGCR